MELTEREEAVSLCRILLHKNSHRIPNAFTVIRQPEGRLEGTARDPADARAKGYWRRRVGPVVAVP